VFKSRFGNYNLKYLEQDFYAGLIPIPSKFQLLPF